jgi:predicted RNase H-like nuclease (RuvC/YqgF family)
MKDKFVAFLKEEIDRQEKQIIALEATLETTAKTKYAKSMVNQQIERAHTQKVQTQVILDKYLELTEGKIVLLLDKGRCSKSSYLCWK